MMDYGRMVARAACAAARQFQLIVETASIIGVSPLDFQTAFDEWHKDKATRRDVALLICKDRAARGAPMPWAMEE